MLGSKLNHVSVEAPVAKVMKHGYIRRRLWWITDIGLLTLFFSRMPFIAATIFGKRVFGITRDICKILITVTSHERYGVSNHRQLDCYRWNPPQTASNAERICMSWRRNKHIKYCGYICIFDTSVKICHWRKIRTWLLTLRCHRKRVYWLCGTHTQCDRKPNKPCRSMV